MKTKDNYEDDKELLVKRDKKNSEGKDSVDNLDDIFLFTNIIKKEKTVPVSSSSSSTVSKYVAIDIAKRYLEYDFCRNFCPYHSLVIKKTQVSTAKKKEREYWLVQVTECFYYYTYISRDGSSFADGDGYLETRDLKKLRCLVDKKTGEYIYYPKENIFHKVIRKLWFLVCK